MAAPVSETIPGRMPPAKLGLILFIVAEIMFFSGLISSFMVFRFNPVQWPPPGQPRLPLEVTSVNTFILLLSGFTMHRAFQALKASQEALFRNLLTVTAVLGSVFLLVQGFEWLRLLHFGLTLHASIFGGFFYCLVGTHALHVTGGLVALLWVLNRAWKGAYDSKRALGVELCRMYWFFVVGLWPLLFLLVYL
ncbi:MAG TPA: heme-copper oxidase subunit III [bacterium]|nr:heme-copper oxidase subunit III [bacterium]